MDNIEIYTDGACSGNPGPGGWSFILLENNKYYIHSGHQSHTTNNQMEMQAVIEALNHTQTQSNLKKFIIYTDSKYVHDGLFNWLPNWKINNWKNSAKQPVKNKELWIKIDQAYQTQTNIQLQWIKGHSISKGNQIADEIAVCASKNHINCICDKYEKLF